MNKKSRKRNLLCYMVKIFKYILPISSNVQKLNWPKSLQHLWMKLVKKDYKLVLAPDGCIVYTVQI